MSLIAAAAVLLLLSVLPAHSQTNPPEASKSGYVGSAVCRTCHPQITTPFFRNPHYKSMASAKEPPERTGCESCHGPANAHVEARGGKTNIIAFSLLKPDQVIDNCLTCHSREFNRAEIRRSEHTRANVACNNCHSIHKAATPKNLLAKQQAPLCYNCHGSVRAQFNMPFKHRVNEGVVQCTDCHNPHGTPAPSWRMASRPRMTDHALGNEQPCLKCHMDLRGPFLFEHAAVRVDGCEACHSPHGSTNPRLLKRPVIYTVCLECHNGAGDFGRQGDGITTQPPSHNMAEPRFRNCTACHVRIHGSNAHRAFLR